MYGENYKYDGTKESFDEIKAALTPHGWHFNWDYGVARVRPPHGESFCLKRGFTFDYRKPYNPWGVTVCDPNQLLSPKGS